MVSIELHGDESKPAYYVRLNTLSSKNGSILIPHNAQ